jgi:hypothetical protein
VRRQNDVAQITNNIGIDHIACGLDCVAPADGASPVRSREAHSRVLLYQWATRLLRRLHTGGGVHLNRQFSQARCEEGYSWGYTDRGIWVDRGCRAEFSVVEPRGNMHPDQRGRFTVLEPGTVLPVRTNETIDSDRADVDSIWNSQAGSHFHLAGRICLLKHVAMQMLT